MEKLRSSFEALANLLAFAGSNLARNARRTGVAVLTIAVGFAALALFAGYTMNVYQGTRSQAIYGEMLGHLVIVKRGFEQEGRLHPERYLFEQDEIAGISNAVRRAVPTAVVAPRLSVSGLISNGRISTIFVAEGVTPMDMATLRGPLAFASGALDAGQPQGLTVSRGLAALLGLKAGDDVSLLGSTIRGQANAVEGQIVDTFDTGLVATNDKHVFVPLEMARALVDAPGRADRLTVVLPDVLLTEPALALILKELGQFGAKTEIRTWRESATAYRQIKGMFDVIFSFLFGIVLALCVMALINVVGMNVVERSREIGALRALGMRRSGIKRLFTTEALLMTILGCILGFALLLLLRVGINAVGFSYTPPNSTDQVPLTVGLNIPLIAVIALFLVLCGGAAAWLATRRAVARSIVDALGHV